MNDIRSEDRAKQILSYLRSETYRYNFDLLPRPFFIEVTGTPSAGKSTTIEELDKFYRRLGFRVYMPQEGAQAIRHVTRDTPVYNIRTGLYALQILIDETWNRRYDVVIFDRCVFDAYFWMIYWQAKGILSKEDETMLQGFFLFKPWLNLIDAAYIMVCDPEEAVKRELRYAKSQILGETTKPEKIAELKARYEERFPELKRIYPQLHMIDTTMLATKEMVDIIGDNTLEIFENQIKI